MALTVSHPFVSAKPDGVDSTLIQPTNWNATHAITGTQDVANGGTGANNAGDARTNLGLGSIATQTASSVTITGGSISGVTITSLDSNTTFQDDVDPTKQMQFQLSGLSGGVTRAITVPDASITLARIDAAQTFTGTQTIDALVATTVNGNTVTTGTGTLTLGAGSTLATSATNSITLTSTAATNVTLPTTGTLATLAGSEALTNKSYNGNTWTAGTGVLTLGAGKTLTASNTLTLAGTDGTTMTFPTTSATLARTDAANSFTGVQTMTSPSITTPAFTGAFSGTYSLGGTPTINVAAAVGGTWTAAATWTLPALTLGGTVTSNGQSFSGTIANLGTVTTADINGGTIDGTVIGGVVQAAGSFTTVNASGALTVQGATGLRNDVTYGTVAAERWLLTRSDSNFIQVAYGADVSTNGTHQFWSSRSDGSNNVISAIVSSTGLAVTGTLSATGALTAGNGENVFGSGGTGATSASLTLNGGSSSGWGSFVTFKRNSVSKGFVGLESQLIGNNSDDTIIYAVAGQSVKAVVNAATIGTFSSTGLAVTGAVSASGSVTSGATGANGQFYVSRSSDGALIGALEAVGNDTVISNGVGGAAGVLIKAAGSTIGTFSSTGLAVTGALSCGTGALTAGAITSSGKADIAWGGYQTIFGLTLGANIGDSTARTDATAKLGVIVVPHYTNAEEPLGVLYGYSSATDNEISYGSGITGANAATKHVFYAAANNTTPTGTEVARISSTGLAVTGTLSATSFLETTEIAAPSAGAANTARIFAVDNGSGKTVLKVQFATGAAQVIATEP